MVVLGSSSSSSSSFSYSCIVLIFLLPLRLRLLLLATIYRCFCVFSFVLFLVQFLLLYCYCPSLYSDDGTAFAGGNIVDHKSRPIAPIQLSHTHGQVAYLQALVTACNDVTSQPKRHRADSNGGDPRAATGQEVDGCI